MDHDTLKDSFRDTFLAGLVKLHASGKLKLEGDEWGHLQDAAAFEEFLQPLREMTWVAFIQPPPKTRDGELASPEHVVKILAKYLTGGPISSSRLLSHEDGKVTFLARPGHKTGGSKEQVPVTVDGVEFVRLWSLYILPKSFVKTRRYGGFSNYHRVRYLAECRRLLAPVVESPAATPSEVSTDSSSDDSSTDQADTDPAEEPWGPCCPSCGERMELTHSERRPSWRDTFAGPSRPRWYDDG